MSPPNPRVVVALLALLLLPGAAHADANPSWSFEVIEVTRTEGDEHLIRLRPQPPGKRFPKSCETFVVRVRYDMSTWSAASRQSVTRAGHERSLRLLAQAQATKDIMHFGAIGQGFAAIPDRPKCEVSSRALVVLVDRDGIATVYSVFNEPRGPLERP
jgi:hypothetical protein